MKESLTLKQEKTNSEDKRYDLSFEKKVYKPNVDIFIFQNAAIAIDTRGINNKELPEIYFGSCDKETGECSIDRKFKNENINMEYVSACIKEVSKASGVSEFFMNPFGDDSKDNKKQTEQARLRLFNRYTNLTPALDGFGYILKI